MSRSRTVPRLGRLSATVLFMAAAVISGLASSCDRLGPRRVMTETETAADRQTLDKLRAAGSDVSRTHTIQFKIHLPTRQDATAVADTLQSNDFDTAVRQDARGRNWLCVAQKEMAPTMDNLTEARALFSTLATQHGGEYDGWEAAVEP